MRLNSQNFAMKTFTTLAVLLFICFSSFAQTLPSGPPAVLYQLDKSEIKAGTLASTTCAADTVRFVRDGKATAFISTTMNVPSEFSGYAQYYDCPQEITVSGMKFYAGVNSTNPLDTALVFCSVYTANLDSSVGSLVTVDTITVYNNYTPTNIDLMINELTFDSAAVMNQPYFVMIQTLTTLPLGVICDDYNVNDGQGEALGYWHWTGDSTWYKSGEFFVWDVDFALEPIVNYTLQDSIVLAVDTTCAGTTVCVSRYASPIVYNRMYNIDAFSGNDSIPFTYDWGYGTPPSIENDSCHIYLTEGMYMIDLTTTINGWTSDCSVTSSDSIVIIIGPSAGYTSSSLGLLSSFTDSSTGSSDTYLWDFGDGNTSSIQNPNHTYGAAGSYTVCLTTSNVCGTDSTCSIVSACELPSANFIQTSGSLTASFTDSSTGPGITYSWDLGDGNTDTVSNPVHTYSADGSYTVCLIVSNSCGADTLCDVITVISTSINELINNSVKVYPNPTENLLNVNFLSFDNGQYSIEILDLSGRLIFKEISLEAFASLNVSKLASGSYLYRVSNETHTAIGKFLKN
ncbi:MAG: PKD repeat protein [Parvicellaceae bacterium]